MKDRLEDTPPSSINGDEIGGLDEDGVLYFEEVEEIQLDDEDMEDIDDQEEEDTEMERPEDLSIMVFDRHSGSVFCCDFHPSGKIAATGGEDDKAYVWTVANGEVLMDCTGHTDSVIFVGFCHDGTYLATIDMCGKIKVWKCPLDFSERGQWPMVFEYEADDPSWAIWHFGARVLMCGGDSGDIYIFKIPSGETKILHGHNVRTDCAKLFGDGKRLAVGYEDGAVKVWDLKANVCLHQLSPSVHSNRITAVDTHHINNLMASISTNGKAILVTPSNGKVVAQLDAEKDLEAVSFCPDPNLGLLALGTLNGSVTVWDTARQMLRHHCAKSEDDKTAGITKMIWVNDQLVTGCLDGTVRVYNGRTGEKCFTLTGHWSEVLDINYNKNENLLLTASDDGRARIFKFAKKDDAD